MTAPSVTIRIDADVHRDTKIMAARVGMTLREFIETALRIAVSDMERNLFKEDAK